MTESKSGAAVTDRPAATGYAQRILKPKSDFVREQMQYREPGAREVLLKLSACGICHSDSFPILGTFPGLQYPIVPGHEIVGTVEKVGSDVGRLKKGDRVGVGWHGGHCHECKACRKGSFNNCEKCQIPGINRDGGYAEYGLFPEEVCAFVPDKITSSEAAPLLCAGITTFNALRNSGARPGDTVAVLGIGGLGHLGVQFANKMGYQTVAIARGEEKAEFSKKLGAHLYINSDRKDCVDELNKIGGANVILATAASSKAMSPWIDALAVAGKLVIVGADIESLTVSPVQLIGGRRSIVGWPAGQSNDSEECMKFAAQTGIRPMIEPYPLEKAKDAYERMMSGKARFRVVLEI